MKTKSTVSIIAVVLALLSVGTADAAGLLTPKGLSSSLEIRDHKVNVVVEDGYVVTAQDVEDELKRIGHDLQPMEIVVINTGAGAAYGSDNYVSTGCGMGREATLYLLERGVRVTGTDAWSWDAPFVHTKDEFAETQDASLIWEGHKAGREIGYCHLEKLHNLEELPGDGFEISCFPVKIRAASTGWTRAVAIFDA